jgi:mRNA interferase MazF
MRRGDIVIAVAPGDHGKRRPAVVVQSDRLAETGSVLLCLITTTERDAPIYRIAVGAGSATGLHAPSQIMVDKIVAIRRDHCSEPVGRISAETLIALDRALAVVLGLAD